MRGAVRILFTAFFFSRLLLRWMFTACCLLCVCVCVHKRAHVYRGLRARQRCAETTRARAFASCVHTLCYALTLMFISAFHLGIMHSKACVRTTTTTMRTTVGPGSLAGVAELRLRA